MLHCIKIILFCQTFNIHIIVQCKDYAFEVFVYISAFNMLFAKRDIVFDDMQLQRLRREPGITHVQRFCTKTGMLKTDDAFKGILLRGVAEDYDTTFLASHFVDGRLPHFSASQKCGREGRDYCRGRPL